MATTYTLISSATVGSGGTSSIDFTSIPQTYTDLLLCHTIRESGNTSTAKLTFNNNTSNYEARWIRAKSTGVNSASSGSIGFIDTPIPFSSTTANTFGNVQIYIPNYTSSNYKSVSVDSVLEDNSSNWYLFLIAGIWSNTSAINQITLTQQDGATFVQYSTAYLYGISNA